MLRNYIKLALRHMWKQKSYVVLNTLGLAVGIASSIAVLLGRVGTNQIPYLMSAVLVAGVLIGAQFGSIVSQRTPRQALRRVLAILITITAIKMWYEILSVI